MDRQMNNKMDKTEKIVSIKWVILTITTVPLLIACISITFIAGWNLDRGIEDQVITGLRSAATGALLSLDNVSLESFQLVGNDLYKGDYNVTQNMATIDYYASSNDVELSFFYGDTRRATTIKDSKGNRVVGLRADDDVVSKVLRQGQEYTSDEVLIDGKEYFGFYMPVNDMASGRTIGMIFAGKENSEITSYIWARINFIIFITIFTYVVCVILVAVVTRKRFLAPIEKLSVVAEKLSRGDINQKIVKETNDEFGMLTDDFANMMANIGKQAHIAERVAAGDLTVSYKPAGAQDVMGNAIKKMVHDNNKSLLAIRDASARMASSANEVAGASNSLAQGSTEQASAIEEISSSISEIANGAKVNADEANRANELVQHTRDGAVQGNEQMKHMMRAMQDIDEASQNISKIMKVIDDIASQTNILALNASVEAARAGVNGKGFAVVADEIRKLAGRSAEAAKNSNELIIDSIKKAEIGTKLADETALALGEIVGSVENIADIVGNIAEASVNQAVSVEQVNVGITQIADVVQMTSATSEECAASSAELSNLAQQLQNEVHKYRLNEWEI